MDVFICLLNIITPFWWPRTPHKWSVKDNILKGEFQKEPAVPKVQRIMFRVEGTGHVSFGSQGLQSGSYLKGKIKFYIVPSRQRCRWVWGKEGG